VGPLAHPGVGETGKGLSYSGKSYTDGRNRYDVTCAIAEDSRYTETVLSQPEGGVLLPHFEGHALCTSPSSATDYLVKLGGNGQCRSSDTACFGAKWTTKCTKLKSYASDLPADSVWRIVARPQVDWYDSCPSDEASLAEKLAPLLDLESQQKTLFSVNVAMNVISGLAVPLFLVAHVCVPNRDLSCIGGKGDREMRAIQFFRFWVSSAGKAAKFVPLLMAMKLSANMEWYYQDLGKAECSDEVTNATLVWVGAQLPVVFNSNVQTLVADILMLLVDIIFMCGKKLKPEEKIRLADTIELSGV